MTKVNTKKQTILFVMALFLIIILPVMTACSQLAVTSITVDSTSYKKEYIVNDTFSFADIKFSVTYSDKQYNKNLTLEEVKLMGIDNLTATAGEKTVTVEYTDPEIKGEKGTVKTTFTVKVYASTEDKNYTVIAFSNPQAITDFNATVEAAGTARYGEDGFEAQFYADKDNNYYVGDDNEFVYKPALEVINGAATEPLLSYRSMPEIKVYEGSAWVALTMEQGTEANTLVYKQGTIAVLTVNNLFQRYQFTADAVNKQFEITVKLASNYDMNDNTPPQLTVKVIDGLNAYDFDDLATMDGTERYNLTKTVATRPAAIILHGDISVTADNIAAENILTSTKEIKTYDADGNEVKTYPVGTKFLRDGTYIIEVKLSSGDEFDFYGNYFTLDLSKVPLVPANNIVDCFSEANVGYGGDFSNAKFIEISEKETQENTVEAKMTMINFNILGNANIEQVAYKESDGDPVFAGGIMVAEVKEKNILNLDNVLCRTLFIPYMSSFKSKLNATNIKCYDSYQDVFYLHGGDLTITDSVCERAGGPMIICCYVGSEGGYSPEVVVTNSIMEAWVTGDEIWFTSLGVNGTVAKIKSLNAALQTAGMGSFLKEIGTNTGTDPDELNDDQLSILSVIMESYDSNLSSVEAIAKLTGSTIVEAKQTVKIGQKEHVASKMYKDTTDVAAQYVQFLISNNALKELPIFGVNDNLLIFVPANTFGNAQPMFLNLIDFVNSLKVDGNVVNAVAASQNITTAAAAFKTADVITLYNGGLTVTMQFMHEQA